MFLTSSKIKFYFRNVVYTFLGIQRHIICNFWICRIIDMKFISLQIFGIDLNLIRLWFDQGSTRGMFQLVGTGSAGSSLRAIGLKGK
jgi:hypothetical protein